MQKLDSVPFMVCLRKTAFGPMAVLWSVYRGRPMILRVLLARPGDAAAQLPPVVSFGGTAGTCPEIDVVADQMVAFLSGDAIRFPLDPVRLDLCTAFQQRVLRAEHAIPRGAVSTYRGIAGHLGQVKAARAVGTALATNPFPIIIPCHRAIRSDRTLGGYQGGLTMKRALLEMEGVHFDALGRVIAGKFFY
jgi:methylated-DNA-[protein]-cysteine S-methyltransferase